MTSSIPAFKAALLARLIADESLDGVGLSRGNPYPSRASDEAVFIGSATAQPLDYMGAMTSANEVYSVDVLVSVIGSSQTAYADLEDRAHAIADVVRASVHSWRLEGFGDTGALMVSPGELRDEENLDDSGREASVTLSIDVTARVT